MIFLNTQIKKAVLDVQKQLQQIKNDEEISDVENKVEILKEQFKERTGNDSQKL